MYEKTEGRVGRFQTETVSDSTLCPLFPKAPLSIQKSIFSFDDHVQTILFKCDAEYITFRDSAASVVSASGVVET